MENQKQLMMLPDLPPEIFLRICSILDVDFVLSTVRLVCKQFSELLGDDKVWKVRLQRRFPFLKLPTCLSNHSSFFFARSCFKVEQEYYRWRKPKAQEKLKPDLLVTGPDLFLTSGHYASADALHLLRDSKLCLSGSRDRSICLWNLDCLDSAWPESSAKNALLQTQDQAHTGWIWSLTSVDNTVYSGGWDCHVREWQLTESSLQRSCGDARCEAAVLSVIAEPNLLAAASYDHRVRIFDPRDLREYVARLFYHNGPVLSIVHPYSAGESSPYFFTCGEDQRVFCVDKRTWTVVSSRRLGRYALDLSYNSRQLWACDSGGRLVLLDPFSSELDVLATFRVSSNKVRSVTHNLGCVMSVSADKKLRVFTPGQQLKTVAEIGPFPSEPTRMVYSKGTLVCAFSDQGLGVWKKI